RQAFAERARWNPHAAELAQEIGRDGSGKTRADTPDMTEHVAFIDAQDERADRLARDARRDVTGDDEFLPCGAFRLDPVLAPPAAIWRVAQLRDDALQAQPAGMAQHHGAAFLEMVAVADEAVAVCDQPFEQGLALGQR